MKPSWIKETREISEINFHAITGRTEANLIRVALLKFLLSLFNEASALQKGFTDVRLVSTCDMQAVRSGKIIDIKFHLQPIGAETSCSWIVLFSSQSERVLEYIFERVLNYVSNIFPQCKDLSDEDIRETEKELLEKMEAYLCRENFDPYIQNHKQRKVFSI